MTAMMIKGVEEGSNNCRGGLLMKVEKIKDALCLLRFSLGDLDTPATKFRPRLRIGLGVSISPILWIEKGRFHREKQKVII
jgi:hypothetical protein